MDTPNESPPLRSTILGNFLRGRPRNSSQSHTINTDVRELSPSPQAQQPPSPNGLAVGAGIVGHRRSRGSPAITTVNSAAPGSGGASVQPSTSAHHNHHASTTTPTTSLSSGPLGLTNMLRRRRSGGTIASPVVTTAPPPPQPGVGAQSSLSPSTSLVPGTAAVQAVGAGATTGSTQVTLPSATSSSSMPSSSSRPNVPAISTVTTSPPSTTNATAIAISMMSAPSSAHPAGVPNEPKTHRIRLVPHLDSRRSLRFEAIGRDLREGDPALRIGRFTDRSGLGLAAINALGSNKLAFKSKVVSRSHAEIWVEAGGKFFIKDTKSSSGTFLNHIRLSPANTESRPFQVKDGDILQLGVDYQGGAEDIYKSVKIRIEVNREWQAGANAFNTNALKNLKFLAAPSTGKNGALIKAKGHAKSHIPDCCICLFSVTIRQALFIAPCSHTFHYKCIRPLLETHHPSFSCPLCRTYADLDEDVEVDADDDVFTNEDGSDDGPSIAPAAVAAAAGIASTTGCGAAAGASGGDAGGSNNRLTVNGASSSAAREQGPETDVETENGALRNPAAAGSTNQSASLSRGGRVRSSMIRGDRENTDEDLAELDEDDMEGDEIAVDADEDELMADPDSASPSPLARHPAADGRASLDRSDSDGHVGPALPAGHRHSAMGELGVVVVSSAGDEMEVDATVGGGVKRKQ